MSGILRRAVVVVLALGALLLAPAGPTAAPDAQAHPLGNFTVNHYDGLTLHPDRVEVLAVLDVAEIPTFQQRASVDTDGDGAYSAAEAGAHATSECAERLAATALTVDGARVDLSVESARAQFPPGDGGVATTRVTCGLVATADLGGRSSIGFTNSFRGDRIGWREITVTGDGMRIVDGEVEAASISDELRAYPDDLLYNPLDQRAATLVAEPGAGGTASEIGLPATGVGWLDGVVASVEQTFNGLVGSERLTPLVGMAAVGLSLLLGASHAALPGHGKTLIAAYLAGRAGTRRDALVVGLTVTLTHTGGVLVLGLAISAVSAFAPERTIRWLGVASGLLIVAIGAWLLVSALRRRSAPAAGTQARVPELAAVGHGHSHGHGHGHGHGHAPGLADRGRFGRSTLIAMGVAAGLVPSPTALLVLVLAIGLGRTWFGVGLVLAYGLGMAGVLTAVGLLLVMLRDRVLVSRLAEPGRVVARLTGFLPVATALVVVVIGLALAVRGITGSG